MRRLIRTKGNDGVALITTIWLTVIGIMLVTTLATLIMGNVSLATSIAADAKAKIAAMSGIEKSIAYLIADRPTPDTPGIIITEIRNAPQTPYLITDTSFETGWDAANADANHNEWAQFQGAVNSVERYSTLSKTGNISLRFVTPSATTYSGGWRAVQSDSINNPLRVNGEDTYIFQISTYRRNGGAYTDVLWVKYGIEWRDASKNLISTDARDDSHLNVDAGVWRDTFMVVQAPSLARFASIIIQAHRGVATTNNHDILVDDLCFRAQDRRYEYVEIYNADIADRNLVTSEYWFASSDTALNTWNRRYLFPLYGTSNTLAKGEVALIIPLDADTFAIINLASIDTSNYKWYGLGPLGGSAVDTKLAFDGNRGFSELSDTYRTHTTKETVQIGFGSTLPTGPPYWFGIAIPDSGTYGSRNYDAGKYMADYSWSRTSMSPYDKHGGKFDTFAVQGSSWETVTCNPMSISLTMRSGIDGAFDTWYKFGFDSYVLLDSSSYDVYYRVRVFDEGAKVNINYLHHQGASSSWESVVFINLLCEPPSPAFKRQNSYWNSALGNIAARDDSAVNLAFDLMRGRFVNNATNDSLLTNLSAYMIFSDTATTISPAKIKFDSAYIPYVSVYGHGEGSVYPVNVNLAESPVLRAALVWALVGSLHSKTDSVGSTWAVSNWAVAVDSARRVADSIVKYLTKFDTIGYVGSGITYAEHKDSLFMRVSDIVLAVSPEYAGDASQLTWAINNNRISSILNCASTNYFTIYATGFAYKKGANVNTDTPASTVRAVAVIRRYTDADKADILYWREIWELSNASMMAHTFPIGSHRYPRYGWDPLQ